jgi:DNA-directed RNA polymerase specialized sigma24 family protein
MPLGTVKTHIHRAKVALKQELLSGVEEDAGWNLN